LNQRKPNLVEVFCTWKGFSSGVLQNSNPNLHISKVVKSHSIAYWRL
jgi:hypothetical protein